MDFALRRSARSPFLPIWPATLLLILLSPVLASGALSESALLGMIPFLVVPALRK